MSITFSKRVEPVIDFNISLLEDMYEWDEVQFANKLQKLIGIIKNLSAAIKKTIEQQKDDISDPLCLPRGITTLSNKQIEIIQNKKVPSVSCYVQFAAKKYASGLLWGVTQEDEDREVAHLKVISKKIFSDYFSFHSFIATGILGVGFGMLGGLGINLALSFLSPPNPGRDFLMLGCGELAAFTVCLLIRLEDAQKEILNSEEYQKWSKGEERAFIKECIDNDAVLREMRCQLSGELPLLPYIDSEGRIYDWDKILAWSKTHNGTEIYKDGPKVYIEQLRYDEATLLGIIYRLSHLIQDIERTGDKAYREDRFLFAKNAQILTKKLCRYKYKRDMVIRPSSQENELEKADVRELPSDFQKAADAHKRKRIKYIDFSETRPYKVARVWQTTPFSGRIKDCRLEDYNWYVYNDQLL